MGEPENGELVKTYAIVTQPANELMSEIHNTKQRMPLILNPDIEKCIVPVVLSTKPI
jgi:putative SOS response-associated peptidase YedK